MWRYCAGAIAILFECLFLAGPASAAEDRDFFATEQYVATGPFARTIEICPKDRIEKPLTLADAVELALCNNPQTRVLWANSRAQAAQLGASMSALLPSLTDPISVSTSRNKVGSITTESDQQSIGVTATYLLYDFGGRNANIENAKQLLIAANTTRDETLQTTFLNAVQSYYTLLSTRASVEAFRTAEAVASKNLDAAKARYEAGTATPSDRLQAQTALSQAVLNRIRAEGDAASAQGALANIMGFDASQHFNLAPVSEPTLDAVAERDIGKLIEEGRQHRPDLAAADAQIRAAEAQLAASRASGLPTVTVDAGISHSNIRSGGTSSTSQDSSLGVTVHVPWFTGFRNTYQNRVAKAQLEGKVASRDLLANQIALEVWNAYQALRTSSEALRAANDLLASAEQSEKVASGRYQAGVGSILDALNAQSALASAQQQRVAALYNFQASKFVLAQAIGQLDLTLAGIKD